jgi:urease accessory protein
MEPVSLPQLLRLLQLTSPALPVGAYAYSRGLEWAVQARWVTDEATTGAWIAGLLCQALAALDVPVLIRLHQAWEQSDTDKVSAWSRYLYASRESAELRMEENQIGRALARLLNDLDVIAARAWMNDSYTTFGTMFTLAAVTWTIPIHETCAGYLWAWAENAVAAAIKLVPLGQTAGQRILSQIITRIPEAVERGQTITDDDIGYATPALALASALHETQHTRLFRS